MLTVTKEVKFCYAHYLPDYKGPCSKLHGHNAKLQVTLQGDVDSETGMIEDFSDLKKYLEFTILSLLDHNFINELAPDKFEITSISDYITISYARMIHNPTAENMVIFIAAYLIEKYGERLQKVRLYETDDSYAEWSDKCF